MLASHAEYFSLDIYSIKFKFKVIGTKFYTCKKKVRSSQDLYTKVWWWICVRFLPSQIRVGPATVYFACTSKNGRRSLNTVVSNANNHFENIWGEACENYFLTPILWLTLLISIYFPCKWLVGFMTRKYK